MSLINEALKKAQKERGAEVPPLAAMPSVGGESPQRISRRGKSSGFPPALLVGGGVLAIAVAMGGVFLLRKTPADQKPAILAEAPAPPQIPAAPRLTPSPPPLATVPASTIVPPVVTTPVQVPAATPRIELTAPAPAPVIMAVAEVPKPAAPTVAAPVTPAPAAAPLFTFPVAAATAPELPKPEPAPKSGKLEPRAINFIESLRVAGIRASATDSKVLMNDRVYRLGTVVEHEMGLRLTGITSNSLTFEDERGGSYTRTF